MQMHVCIRILSRIPNLKIYAVTWNKMLIALQRRIKSNQEKISLDRTLVTGIPKLNTAITNFITL